MKAYHYESKTCSADPCHVGHDRPCRQCPRGAAQLQRHLPHRYPGQVARGNVFINGKKATLKTLAPAAYSATNGKVVIGITFDLPASEPTLDYVIKHDRRAHGFCTVHAWSAGKAAALPMAKGDSPYQGKWVAKNRETGATVANIQVDGKEQVWVNGVKVKAKRADGALQFRQGTILYTLQGDPRIRDESDWNDSDVQNTGPIRLE